MVVEDDSNSEKKNDEISSSRRKNSKPRKIERDGTNLDAFNLSSQSDSTPRNNKHSSFNDDNNEDQVPDNHKNQVDGNFSSRSQKQGELVYACVLCPEKFREPNFLSQHMLQTHGYEGPLDFSNNARPTYGEELAESLMESETVFCCEICVREFGDRGSLWLHLLYTHKNAASKACGICLKICEDTNSLQQHVEMAHPKGRGDGKTEQRRYSCQVCARQHDSRKKLVTHAKIHKLVDADGNPIDPETVVVQNAEFYSDGFIPHPMDDNYLSCEICFKVFDNDTKLLKHKKNAHRDSSGVMDGTMNPGAYNFYFACEICGLSHLSRSDRWKHMSTTHAGDPLVTCEIAECGKVFPTSSLKKEHATHHTAQGQFPNTCEVCGKMWKTRVEYWKHMMGVHPDYLPFICGVCLKVFCNLTSLVNHVRETHWPLLGGDFCCDICGRPYSKVSKMTRHRKIHYVPDNPPELQALLDNPKVQNEPHFLQQSSSLTCDMCENSSTEFGSVEELGKHRQEVHSVMPCDLCTKYYGRTSHLWKHVNKIHKGHPDVTCPTCQRTSASKAHLATHIAKHHKKAEEKAPTTSRAPREPSGVHACEKCSKIFRKESLMNKHLKHCKGPRAPTIPIPPPVDGVYQCDRCEKSFSARSLLYKHIKHSHVFFGCELCDFKAGCRTELYQHVCKDHADDSRVKCDKCNKILRCPADLEKHRKGHNLSFLLHCCKFCAELVTSKYKLRRHLKGRHINESKFLCALCLEDLPNIEELVAHVETNHKTNLGRGFTCQICAKPCTNKSKLTEHIKYHGPNYSACKICLKIFSSKEELQEHTDNHPIESEEEEEEQINEDMDVDSSIVDSQGGETNKREGEDEDDKSGDIDIDDDEEKPRKKSKLEVECSECSEIFYSKMSLRRHLKSVHNIKPLIGRFSGESKNSSAIDTSVTDKSGWEDTTIDSNKGFLQQLGLIPENKARTIRKVYHDNESPSECELCGKVWPVKKHLWQHLVRYHKNDCGKTCGVCLKFCPDYPCLSAHLAIEHPNNFDDDGAGLVCRVCGKYHNAKSKLFNHSSVHIGHEERATDPNHHCLICKEKFKEFSQFIDHIKTEHNIIGLENQKSSNEQNKTDEQIEDAASELGHKPSESQKLPFHTCDVCSLVFASEIGLANHKRIHENSDNFKCGQCGEVFQSAENLCTHKLQKHKGTEFVCADCKSNFSTYNQLTEHNKLCKMKQKNMDENSDDEDFILNDEMLVLETSYDVNDTIMSSGSEKSDFPDENDLESDESLSDDEKYNLSKHSQKENKSVEKLVNENSVEADAEDNSKL